MALFLSNCGRLGKGEKTESAIVISPLGEEAEDAILLELVTEPIGGRARYRGLGTPVSRHLCRHSAAPWPILQIGRHLT